MLRLHTSGVRSDHNFRCNCHIEGDNRKSNMNIDLLEKYIGFLSHSPESASDIGCIEKESIKSPKKRNGNPNELQVSVKTATKTIFPRRGMLAEFWPLGCASPRETVDDGYLLWRNDTTAVFSCSAGSVFVPEMRRERALRCVAEGSHAPHWDRDVGHCIPVSRVR